MNVLDLPGPAFLRLYLGLFAVAVATAFLLRWWLRHPGGDLLPRQLPDLHPLEIAYLAGGPTAVADAAIGSLVHRGSLCVEKRSGRLVAANGPPADATPLEEAVYDAVEGHHAGGVPGVRRAVHGPARSAAGRLESLGLVVGDGRARVIGLAPAAVLLALLLLGALKVAVGVERNRPVGFLVVLCLVTAAAAAAFALVLPLRTRRGTRVLNRLKRTNAALRTTASRAPNSLVGDDLAMTLALFSAGAFAFGPMSDVDRALSPRKSRQSGHGDSSSGCGSGTTGGGDSGDGGGGGGCGGCGGGGD